MVITIKELNSRRSRLWEGVTLEVSEMLEDLIPVFQHNRKGERGKYRSNNDVVPAGGDCLYDFRVDPFGQGEISFQGVDFEHT